MLAINAGVIGGGFIGVLSSATSNFFSSVIYYLTAIWEFLYSFAESLKQFLAIVMETLTIPITLMENMWAPLRYCIGILLLVGVIKLILGWGNT